MDLYDIIDNSGMSSRPAFYSGRGAVTCDLNGRILEKLHTGIKSTYGDEAAAAFVYMVADLPILSATDFLLALFRLEESSWKWKPTLKPQNHGISYTNKAEAICTVAQVLGSVFGGNLERDETITIRSGFLRDHKKELPKKMQTVADICEWDYYCR